MGEARATVRPEQFASATARAMAAAANAVNAERYGSPDATPIADHEFEPAGRGLFLVAYLDDDAGPGHEDGPGRGARAVGCVGFRQAEPPWPADTAELKRMYVDSAARRQGLGRLLLRELEAAARAAGYTAIVLDTGDRQPEAIALYETAGFERVPGYSIYRRSPRNRAYRKALAPERSDQE